MQRKRTEDRGVMVIKKRRKRVGEGRRGEEKEGEGKEKNVENNKK